MNEVLVLWRVFWIVSVLCMCVCVDNLTRGAWVSMISKSALWKILYFGVENACIVFNYLLPLTFFYEHLIIFMEFA